MKHLAISLPAIAGVSNTCQEWIDSVPDIEPAFNDVSQMGCLRNDYIVSIITLGTSDSSIMIGKREWLAIHHVVHDHFILVMGDSREHGRAYDYSLDSNQTLHTPETTMQVESVSDIANQLTANC